MKKYLVSLSTALVLFGSAFTVHSEAVKVVPGGTIQPESGSGNAAATPVKKKKKAVAPAGIKAGQTFFVELAVTLNSAVNKPGDKVYFRAAEDVSSGGKASILRGALGEGQVTASSFDKNNGALTVQLQKIEAANGQMVNVQGELDNKQEKAPAILRVGEKFSAILNDKLIVKAAKPAPKPANLPNGFASVNLKTAKIDAKKGRYQGKVEVTLEGPKGTNAEDIEASTLILYQVNEFTLPKPLAALPNPKKGDNNKNGTSDWTASFGTWDFMQWLRAGNNQVFLKVNSKNGPFMAVAGVEAN